MKRIYGAIVLLIAVTLLTLLGLSTFGTYRAKNWPIAQGKTLENKIDEHLVKQTGEKQALRMATRFRPEIRYRYDVAGVSFEGDRYSFDATDYGDRASAEKEIAPYANTETIDVYYDPAEPSRSVLRPGFLSWVALAKHLALYIFPIFFIVLGIVLWRGSELKSNAAETIESDAAKA